MVMPGDNVTTLPVSSFTRIAMEEGLKFAIREVAAPLAPAA